jgi:hypothetical protein
MAAAEHAITISDESVAMELPTLPPNQGLEAMKDIVFGSVSGVSCVVGNVDKVTDLGSQSPGGWNGRKTHRISLRHGQSPTPIPT